MKNGNGITVVLFICYLVTAVCKTKNGVGKMPPNWPPQWNGGIIPFVFDYYSGNLKRLINMVQKAVKFIEDRGCLMFKEQNPIEMAQKLNATYLYYSFSGVLEECCGTYFNKKIGRRLVLITPLCRNPAEIVHATLHAMGLTHNRNSRFSSIAVNSVLFPNNCVNMGSVEQYAAIADADGLLDVGGADIGTPFTRRPQSEDTVPTEKYFDPGPFGVFAKYMHSGAFGT